MRWNSPIFCEGVTNSTKHTSFLYQEIWNISHLIQNCTLLHCWLCMFAHCLGTFNLSADRRSYAAVMMFIWITKKTCNGRRVDFVACRNQVVLESRTPINWSQVCSLSEETRSKCSLIPAGGFALHWAADLNGSGCYWCRKSRLFHSLQSYSCLVWDRPFKIPREDPQHCLYTERTQSNSLFDLFAAQHSFSGTKHNFFGNFISKLCITLKLP